MKGKSKSKADSNPIPAQPLAQNITVAQVEAAIGYWRRQFARRKHHDGAPPVGERETSALEVLYARLLAARHGAVRTEQLSTYEYDALLSGLPK